MSPDPYLVLGIDRKATLADVAERRRELALVHHPDRGGDSSKMTAINIAADSINQLLLSQDDAEPSPPVTMARHEVERSSFTIDALPAVAFEVAVLAARVLGDLADDDPPYALEMVMEDPPQSWCRLEFTPDAGSSTVHVIGDASLSLEELREIWTRTINELDLTDFA